MVPARKHQTWSLLIILLDFGGAQHHQVVLEGPEMSLQDLSGVVIENAHQLEERNRLLGFGLLQLVLIAELLLGHRNEGLVLRVGNVLLEDLLPPVLVVFEELVFNHSENY